MAKSSATEEDADNPNHEQQYNLLEELQEIVESLDFAQDLHRIGGLPTLLALMGSNDPGLRWRAAEVLATCVANHISVQQVGSAAMFETSVFGPSPKYHARFLKPGSFSSRIFCALEIGAGEEGVWVLGSGCGARVACKLSPCNVCALCV